MAHSSLVLTGFMGTGKTTVGKIVAAKLGRAFVDMDTLIQAREGRSVRALFETHGEKYFREREAALCAELGAQNNLVVATGGGALVDPENRAALANARIICLDASRDAILARLRDALDRPLLSAPDPRAQMQALLDARAKAYRQIQLHVDTTNKTPEQVADEIIALYRAREICVALPDAAYAIHVGAGLLAQVGALVSSLDDFSKRCAIVTNSQVAKFYAPRVIDSLRAHGFAPAVIEIPDGERFKTIATLDTVYDKLIDAQLERRSIIFALGGGVVGDLAGLAAATFLRGVAFAQLPTTLLAMVDASVGGKVAVDHPRGKNLIGAFKQPRLVIADTHTLATLPDAELRSGMAEVVKHGIIGDAELFELLESAQTLDADECGQTRREEIFYARSSAPICVQPNFMNTTIVELLRRAIQVKVDIVSRDPCERDERAKLNLGHTFGHALETLSNYQMRHGDGVAIGLVCAARLAARRKMCDAPLVTRIENLLRALGLPTHVPREMASDAIIAAMSADKKRVAARLRFILPRALGNVAIVDDVTRAEIAAALEEARE